MKETNKFYGLEFETEYIYIYIYMKIKIRHGKGYLIM